MSECEQCEELKKENKSLLRDLAYIITAHKVGHLYVEGKISHGEAIDRFVEIKNILEEK